MLNSFINGVASVFMVMPVANIQPIKAATVTMPSRQGTARYWLHVGQHLVQPQGQRIDFTLNSHKP